MVFSAAHCVGSRDTNKRSPEACPTLASLSRSLLISLRCWQSQSHGHGRRQALFARRPTLAPGWWREKATPPSKDERPNENQTFVLQSLLVFVVLFRRSDFEHKTEQHWRERGFRFRCARQHCARRIFAARRQSMSTIDSGLEQGTDAWLTARRRGVTASDAAAVCGCVCMRMPLLLLLLYCFDRCAI